MIAKLSEYKKSNMGYGIFLVSAICLFNAILTCNLQPAAAKERLSISGITEPIHDVTLSATVSGRVVRILFKEGEKINKGATILELDKKLEKLEVERRKLIWESKAELESAKSQVRTLGAILNSTRVLYESTGSVSKEEVEKQELEYAIAVSNQQRLENDEERERIEYEMALEQYRKRVLKAPFQGILTELFLNEGETLEVDEPLVHMVDISQCVFVCNVEERIGRNLKINQHVEFKILAGNDSLARMGKIVFVSPVVDPASGLLKVKAVFDNKDGEIHPGVAGIMYLDNAEVAAE